MNRPNKRLSASLALALAGALTLSACGERPKTAETEGHAAKPGEYERGPHRGRMLRAGDFALEVTIFEDGVEPEFHVYAYRKDKPIAPTLADERAKTARMRDYAAAQALTVPIPVVPTAQEKTAAMREAARLRGWGTP